MPFSSNPVLVAAAVFLAAASPAMTQAAQAVTCGYFGTSPVVGGAYHQFYLDLTGRSGNTAVRISTVTSTIDTTVCVGTELADDSHTTTLGEFAVPMNSYQENFEIPLAPGVQLVQVGAYYGDASGTLVLSISCRDTTLPAEVLEQDGARGCQISTNSPTFTSPTMSPTANPTFNPTRNPTANPTMNPTANPTRSPTTANPTSNPTRNPTANPTMNPTANPTRSPTGSPTVPNIIQRWVTRYAQASTRNQMLSAGDSQTNLAAITTMQGGAEVTRNDRFGNPLWTITLATEMNAVSVASDRADNVIITGGTTGDVDGGPNQGGTDAYVTSYSPADGSIRWSAQIGTAAEELGKSVATDSSGNVFVTGSTTGAVGGVNQGSADCFVTKLDGRDGTRMWTRQFGSPQDDQAYAISASDSSGTIQVRGYSKNAQTGNWDLVIVKYDTDGNQLGDMATFLATV